MSKQISFKVSADENAAEHTVNVRVRDYSEATEKEKQSMWAEGMKSVRIKAQGAIRPLLKKDQTLRAGAKLDAIAQAKWDSAFSGMTVAVSNIVDAGALFGAFDLEDEAMVKVARTQMDMLLASGATLVNIPAALAGK